ncbi:hypothetical protein BDF21DRAFT_403192 [Thamnidium elegans]|nr:hypothetical protein BDF21DRAFT_403192 [Thamnidium elegans]
MKPSLSFKWAVVSKRFAEKEFITKILLYIANSSNKTINLVSFILHCISENNVSEEDFKKMLTLLGEIKIPNTLANPQPQVLSNTAVPSKSISAQHYRYGELLKELAQVFFHGTMFFFGAYLALLSFAGEGKDAIVYDKQTLLILTLGLYSKIKPSNIKHMLVNVAELGFFCSCSVP